MASMVTLQWFTTLFSYSFNFDVLVRLWDLVFIKGNKILFRISLAIFHLMEDELLECHGINTIMSKMETISLYLQDPYLVLQVASMPQYKIKGAKIEAMRREQRLLIIEEMIQFKTKVNEKFEKFDFSIADQKTTEPRFDHGQFLGSFPMFKGIQ